MLARRYFDDEINHVAMPVSAVHLAKILYKTHSEPICLADFQSLKLDNQDKVGSKVWPTPVILPFSPHGFLHLMERVINPSSYERGALPSKCGHRGEQSPSSNFQSLDQKI